MTENKNYLNKYAMHFGTYLGIYWIAKFILFPLGIEIPFLSLLFLVLTLAVPFLGYYYTRMYRDKVCNGSITFLHAWLFTLLMYIFASLLAAVAHYIYFQYLDHGYLYNAYSTVIQNFKELKMADIETSLSQIETTVNLLGSLSPIELTVWLISQDIFYGGMLAIPTALFVMKRKKTLTTINPDASAYSEQPYKINKTDKINDTDEAQETIKPEKAGKRDNEKENKEKESKEN